MKVISITGGMLATNTYLIINEITKDAIIVDPSDAESKILKKIEEQDANVTAVLLTHGHFDHIGSVKALQDRGAKVYMHENDIWQINNPESLASRIGLEVKSFTPDYIIKNEEVLKINGLKIKVIETPGHTNGGVCYVIDNLICTGDTIFKDSYGRVDFRDSSFDKIKASICKIFSLEGDYILLPGHGPNSLLSYERENNPIRNDYE